MKVNIKHQIYVGFIILILVYIYIINLKIPMMGEDFALITTSKDYIIYDKVSYSLLVLNRIIKQMTEWNIRIGEQFSIIFGSINKFYFVIYNTIITMIYMYLISLYGEKKEENLEEKYFKMISAFCIIINFQPAIGEIFFWRTGSTNYLWSISILLLFYYPINKNLKQINFFKNRNKLIVILYVIFGYIAGLTNENTVIVILSAILLLLAYNRYILNVKNEYWIMGSFCSLSLGFITMIFAPSTQLRIKTYNKIFGISHIGVLDYYSRLINVIRVFIKTNWKLILLALIINLIYVLVNKYKISKQYKILLFNTVVSFLGGLSLIGAPYVETRAFLIVNFFIISLIIFCLNEVIKKKLEVIILIMLITFPKMIKIFNEYSNYYDYSMKNIEKIELYKKNQKNIVEIEPYKYISNSILNTREDYNMANLEYLKDYYGIKIKYDKKNTYKKNQSWINISKNINNRNLFFSIDYFDYNIEKKFLEIIGWGNIEGYESKNLEKYLVLKSNTNEYWIPMNSYKRQDVKDYLKNNKFLNSGFYLKLYDIKDYVLPGEYNVELGLMNSKKEYILVLKNNKKVII